MELKQFVKGALKDLVDAVEEARQEACRDMRLTINNESRTVEFDIAVTIEEATNSSGKAGIKIAQIIEGGGNISKELKNSEVSRIKFGVFIDNFTKEEQAKIDAEFKQIN